MILYTLPLQVRNLDSEYSQTEVCIHSWVHTHSALPDVSLPTRLAFILLLFFSWAAGDGGDRVDSDVSVLDVSSDSRRKILNTFFIFFLSLSLQTFIPHIQQNQMHQLKMIVSTTSLTGLIYVTSKSKQLQ